MTELEPPVINNEIADQKPFVIRAHHLSMYIPLIQAHPLNILSSLIRNSPNPYQTRVFTPVEMAESMRRTTESLKSLPIGSLEERNYWIAYRQDVIGASAESTNKYENDIRKTFERFLSLPDDYPAELTENIPDVICEACAIGDHCRHLGSFAKYPVDGSRDASFLDKFLKNLNLLNLSQPEISEETAHFPNTDPMPITRIKTTMGAVRKVLKETEAEMWSLE